MGDGRRTDIVVVGAGPYGLSLAAHLGHRAADFRIFGDPLVFWRRMLRGINLKSPDFGSNLSMPEPGNTFIEWCDARGLSRQEPIPMSRFTEYASDIQHRHLPMVEPVEVARVRRGGDGFEVGLADGTRVSARRVVLAVGLSHFTRMPSALARLPREFVTHTRDHSDYDGWNGREVVVVGAGQSAVEATKALLDAGASVTMLLRGPRAFFTPVPSGRARSLRQRMRWPRTVMGEGWLGYSMQHVPIWPHLLPQRPRTFLTRRFLGPYATWWLREVEARAPMLTRTSVVDAQVRGSRVELRVREGDPARERVLRVDHVVCGTGFEVDVDRIPFLAPELAARIARSGKAPRLSRHFESSVPGLFFVGPASALSFGPLLRFVCGAEYAAPALARHLAVPRPAWS